MGHHLVWFIANMRIRHDQTNTKKDNRKFYSELQPETSKRNFEIRQKKFWCPPAALPELLNGCNKRGWNMLKSPLLMLIFPTKAPLSMASSGIVQPHLTSGGDNEMKLAFPAGTLVKLLAPQKPWYVCYSSINRGKTIKNHPFGNGLVYTTYKDGDSGDGLLLFYPHDIQVCVFQQPLSLISHTMASPSQSVGAIEDHQ